MFLSPQAGRDLAWDQVCGYLAGQTRTPMGREGALGLHPTSDLGNLRARRDRVVEMMRVHAEQGRLPLEEVIDPTPLLSRMAIEGSRLGGKEIYQILHLLAVGRALRRDLAALAPESFPALGADWTRLPDLDDLIDQIDGRITPAGLLEDHASPELHRIRGQVRTLSERLTGTLDGILRSRFAEKVLRDDYITLRNNRFVLPVRTDAPYPMEGIVHGTSGTGQTLFIEPLETVSINNELVRLKDEEAREEERILREWTSWMARWRGEIEVTALRISEMDLLEALAVFAESSRAVPAAVGESDRIVLRAARHPVLEKTLTTRSDGEGVVPLDVTLEEGERVLVISGPNTGGKTVALKTIGLLTVMAHAGLPVPAAEAGFPLVESVLVDIGDHQSIQASLSTFSSHVENIAGMIGQAGPRSLVLLDEVGTGTDPAEGAALATAVLDRLRQDGARVVATTHHGSVKAWAFNTEGVASAACEFDEASLRPTYRLLTGVAGASSGLAIAERLGLPPEVVTDALNRLDPRGVETERYLARLRQLAGEREEAVRKIEGEVRQLRTEREEQSRTAEEKENRRRDRFARELEQVLSGFRREAGKLLARVRDARERRALERERARQEAVLRRKISREITARTGGTRPPPPPEGWIPEVGRKVQVTSLGREGMVRAVEDGEAEVLLGRATFRVKVSDLRPVEGEPTGRARPLPPGVSARLEEREPVALELRVIGQTVEEARSSVDKYLDDAILSGHAQVRIIHGHGSGRLRRALRDMLTDHPHVVSSRPGEPGEGGDGATVVQLRV